jgi:hypothetical protein
VVLLYEPGEAVLNSVDALQGSDRLVDELAVVDNCSSVESLAPLRATYPDVAINGLPENGGYGAAMNKGASRLIAAGCDTLLFLTQDTVLSPQAIEAMVDGLSSDGDVAIVGPLLCRRSAPDEIWSAGGSFTRPLCRPRHRFGGEDRTAAKSGVCETEWLDGACLLISVSDFQSVGGFREDLFLYWEDVDLCLRLGREGRKSACVLDAVAFQESSSAPPYLDARNRVLVLPASGKASVLLEIVARALADPFRGRGLRRSRLMYRGLRDAQRGTLDRSCALERPR